MRPFASTLVVLVVLVGLPACREAVISNRAEAEANTAVAALSAAGLDARKRALGRDQFDVTVPRGQFDPAVHILAAEGLPATDEPGVAELFRERGLVPSGTEEHVRYHRALAGDLSRTLRQLTGVRDVRVHLAVPPPSPRARRTTPLPTKAAVLVRSRPGAFEALEARHRDFQELVAGAVPGLTPESVSVVITRTDPPASPARRVETPGRRGLLLGSAASVFAGLGIAGLFLFRHRSSRRTDEESE